MDPRASKLLQLIAECRVAVDYRLADATDSWPAEHGERLRLDVSALFDELTLDSEALFWRAAYARMRGRSRARDL
jgi:hypothetical protein